MLVVNRVDNPVASLGICLISPNSSLAFIAYGQGSLWGTVFFNGNRIYKINPNEINDVVLFAGSTQGNIDGDISVATFDSPSGIVYNDVENALYISEYSADGNIRKIEGIPLSVEDFSSNIQLTLYPNPAMSFLELEGTLVDALGETKISIYDLSGRLINTQSQELNERGFHITVDISTLMGGVYLLELQSNNGVFIAKRFIKSR